MLPLAFVERDWQHYSSVESGIDRQVCQRGRVVIQEKIATITGILHDAAKAPDLRPLGPRGEYSRGIRDLRGTPENPYYTYRCSYALSSKSCIAQLVEGTPETSREMQWVSRSNQPGPGDV